MFETILNEMRILPNTQLFLHPVNPKNVPDYYTIVQKPMDLQTMRENNRKMKYQTRELFLNDLNQIIENSKIYNGWGHLLTVAAQSMLDHCLQRCAEREQKFMRLEKAINPLLDDNDQVALSYMFEIIIGKMKAVENSWPFHQPVNKKNLKDYCSIIKKPMDLATLLKNVQDNKYNTREQFMKDVQLLYTNSLNYNGPDSSFTQTAKRMMEVCHECLSENEEYLAQLEADIASKEAALDGLDSESVMTGTSLHLEDSLVGGDGGSRDSYSLDDNTIAEDDLTSLSLQPPKVFHQPQEASSDSEFIDVEGDSSDELASKMTCIPSRKRRFSQVETDIDVCQAPDDIYTPYDIVEDRDHTDAAAEDDDRHDDILGHLSDSEGEDQSEKNAPTAVYDQHASLQADSSHKATVFASSAREQMDTEDTNFDPAEFFRNSALASEMASCIADNRDDDLQLSDSDQEGVTEEDETPLIPTENQNCEGFDIDEYL